MAAHIETGATAHPALYRSKQPDHLGLVAGMCDEPGIAGPTGKLIPQDREKRKVSVGQAVRAMIPNGLGFANRALHLTELFFRDKPANRLIGEGTGAGHPDEDTLGRTPDALHTAGVNGVYSPTALPAVRHLGLLCRFGHTYSTGFHADGKCSSGEAPEDGVIHITQGYSRDHRPDLNQSVLQLPVGRQAGIPLPMRTLSGNNSGRESFRGMVTAHPEQMRDSTGIGYLIAGSALYSAENPKATPAASSFANKPSPAKPMHDTGGLRGKARNRRRT